MGRMRQLKIAKQVTNRDPTLDKYLTEIGKVKLLTASEEVSLAQRIKQGDEDAFEMLVKANLRFVVSVAKQYQNQGMSLPDLINEGNAGLIKAARRFDETRGFKFISYAVWWIRQQILQSLAEQGRIVRLPLNKIQSLSKINKAFAKLEQEYERPPTVDELAEVLSMTPEEVRVSQYNMGPHASLDAPFREGQDSGTLLDVMENVDLPDPEQGLIKASLATELERAMSVLREREREVIVEYYGLKDKQPKTLEEVGALFDLTRERVRQIKEKAIRRLKISSSSKSLLHHIR